MSGSQKKASHVSMDTSADNRNNTYKKVLFTLHLCVTEFHARKPFFPRERARRQKKAGVVLIFAFILHLFLVNERAKCCLPTLMPTSAWLHNTQLPLLHFIRGLISYSCKIFLTHFFPGKLNEHFLHGHFKVRGSAQTCKKASFFYSGLYTKPRVTP